MNPSRSPLSAEAVKAIERGQLVDAIKLTREQTGLGLKEAKELVEAYGRERPRPRASGLSSSIMPTEAVVALQKGGLLDAIKAFREKNGQGLKDSKEAVERYLDEHPLTKRQFSEARSRERRRVAKMIMLVVFAILVLGYWLSRGQLG